MSELNTIYLDSLRIFQLVASKVHAFRIPGGPVVKNPPANAGDTGSIPNPGRFHMLWGNEVGTLQLLKPTCSRALLCNKGSQCNEKPMATVTTISPSICREVMGPDAMILVF